jgi:ribose transport system ATP-binding protein
MHDITVAYGPVQVLHGVALLVMPGEIHALLGENGAGKSSLMNVLGGVVAPQRGTVAIDGAPVALDSPRAARRAGVAFIHQELNLVNDLSVWENLFLGQERHRFGVRRAQAMRTAARAVLARLGVEIEPEVRVASLDAAHKQFVEVARALLFEARIVIMDEPTTALTEAEVERLFAVMRQLKGHGVSLIYISHKLRELKAVCDRYTVLRDGRVAAAGEIAGTDEHALADAMIGRSVPRAAPAAAATVGAPALQVHDLAGEGVDGVSFELRRGEVIGLTGLAGDGRAELVDLLVGERPLVRGRITIEGRAGQPRSPCQALRRGLGLVPRNRKENSIVKDQSIQHNLSLASLAAVSRAGWVRARAEAALMSLATARLAIKLHRSSDPITSLSGGNQQKVVIAKWLATGAPVLLLDNLTQGIDVGAKAEIHPLVRALAGEGKAVIVSSAEVAELQQLCDRVLVFYRGRIVAELAAADVNEDRVMRHATGALLS